MPHRADFLLRWLGRGVYCAIGLSLTGCVSTKYKLAKKDTAPAVPLNLAAENVAASGAVQTVIVQKGPGSWKREAWWDEYVISVTNRGTVPLELVGATLLDFQDEAVLPGGDPWLLEKQSQIWWKRARDSQTATLIAIGAGTVVGAAAITASALGSIMAGAASAGGGAAAGGVVVLALPIYAVAVVVINSNNKHDVLAEFQRRRLPLPLVLAPGETRAGSIFFRISPGPKKLSLSTTGVVANADLNFDLTPLADLHLKAPAAKPKPVPSQ